MLWQETQETLRGYYDSTAVVVGTVAAEPDYRETALRVVVAVEQINGGTRLPAGRQGKLLAILPRDTELSYGNRVEIRGHIEAPAAFETDTGRMFDYPGYLRVRGVSALMSYAVLRDSKEAGWSLFGVLYAAKHEFKRSLEKIFAEPQGALMEGMLLGERRGLPERTTQALIVSGLIHVVVLSGYNISIVAELVLRLFGAVLPRRGALLLGGVAIIAFAMMAGAGAATVRATLMGVIAVVARYLRRPAAAMRALAIAAGAMALWNPLVLVYDPGFVLSVLATFGLIALSPSVESRLRHIPAWKYFDLRAVAASTISVQLFILPALLYYMGVLSFVSVPANLLALPVVPAAMLLGFAAGLLGLIAPVLALVPALVADLLLRWMLGVAETAASLPFAAAEVVAFPWWVAALAYVPLTAWAIWLYLLHSSATSPRPRRSGARTPTS